MVKQIKDFTLQMIAGANVVTVVAMLLVGLSDRINPAEHPFLANAGLLFPGFILINLCFLFFFVIFKRKYVLITFLGLVACYFPVRTYSPLNVRSEVPVGAIKVLSYNVNNFNKKNAPEDDPNPILSYILNSEADIVCLQESNITQEILDGVKGIYDYVDSVRSRENRDCIALLSKYPIISKEHIPYESRANISAAFKVKIGRDTVVVINNHFESSGLSMEDRAGFKDMVKGKAERDTMRAESRRLLTKLGEAARIRAPQVEAVAEYVRNCRQSVILCGDFNDSPISYAHQTLARELTDCYVSTGNGPGISYHGNAIFVRIDNIMCSTEWRPYGCKVDRSIGYSDHYPIYCWLEKRSKDKKQ